MKKAITVAERIACTAIGAGLFIVGLVFMALGVTFLPIVGVFAAVPVMFFAFQFLRPGKWAISVEAEISPVKMKTGFREPLPVNIGFDCVAASGI